jgi:uncharacterized repeat protein (TIGR03806 family)
MSRLPLHLCWMTLLVACDSRQDARSFGLTERVVVQGLTFPTGLPAPQPVRLVSAFPALAFDSPLWFGVLPDGRGRVVVAEQVGVLRSFVHDAGATTAPVFLDIRDRVNAGGEEGLLGVAFHPDYASNGWFYVYYSASAPRRSVIARYRVSAGNPDVADRDSEQILLQIEQPFANHNAGALAFGPDGMLYVASGDGGSGNDPFNNAQSLGTLLGKILRLTPEGGVPIDNPFVGVAGARGEIWAYGLRNPWRMSFDRETGALWAGDVGQGAQEEIDLIVRGGNYGWRVYEGTRSNVNPQSLPPEAFLPPVHSYERDVGISVTGGVVYRGTAIPSLRGAYLYADFSSGNMWALVHDGTQKVSNVQVATATLPSSFGEDSAGEVYVCSFDGRIYRLADGGSGGGGGASYPVTLSASGLFTDLASLTPAPGVIEYDVNAALWSDGARKRRFMALPGSAQVTFAADEAFRLPVGTVLVKHFEIELATGANKRLETRVLVHHVSGWEGRTYRWTATGTDAVLLSGAEDETIVARDEAGGARVQTWHYPSPSECMTCHTAAAGRVLGLRAAQLNRLFPYPGLADNQLRSWNHIALFTRDIGAHGQFGALADPADVNAGVAERARAYLDVNCANCHRSGGPTPVDLDLRAGLDVTQLRTHGVPASNPVGGDPSRLRVAPGDKARSDLWERLRRRDVFAMPPLGSHVVDPLAVQLIGAWIDG